MKSVNIVNTMPKLSVIIPVWGDYIKYLDTCLLTIECQKFKDYEIIVVDTETDLPTARNKGIEKAKGEYILCMDVDDRLDYQHFEKTVGQGDIVGTWQKEFGAGESAWCNPKLNPTLQDFESDNQICACSVFKKEIWKKIGGYDESMKDGYEDWDFWLRALRAGYKVKIIPEILFFYNKHGKSLITNATDKHKELKNYIMSK